MEERKKRDALNMLGQILLEIMPEGRERDELRLINFMETIMERVELLTRDWKTISDEELAARLERLTLIQGLLDTFLASRGLEVGSDV